MSEAVKKVANVGDKVVITSANQISHMNCVVLAIDEHGIAVNQLGKPMYFGWNMVAHLEKQTPEWQPSRI